MMGVRKGVAALLKEGKACIVRIHCFAHRLELAYKESLTKVALGEKVVMLLKSLYYFYHNSPLNRSNLRSSFKALGKKVVIPSQVGGSDRCAMFRAQIFSGAMRHYCYTCNSLKMARKCLQLPNARQNAFLHFSLRGI